MPPDQKSKQSIVTNLSLDKHCPMHIHMYTALYSTTTLSIKTLNVVLSANRISAAETSFEYFKFFY